ncbi:energy-coupling factor ABC transporter permease [Altericista sp. CCNU0014]|uniref:energy-coupling factor ABC transporter permease n=1 Tax=Altericista sp. CCNU0014 TaxID=3082949 RepID=UPI003850A813
MFSLGLFSQTFQPRLALHVPDGFLNGPVLAIAWLISIGLIALALRQVQAEYRDRAVPLMGVCAAFIFAAQMINFPIPGGTSGHLLGGTLAGALLGPWAGSLVMAVVFIVQGVVFQDGGITAMGANIFNMGLIGTFGGYYVLRTIRNSIGRDKLSGMVVGTAVAAWLSVVVASVFCALELAISGTVPLNLALGAMVGWHIFIGIGEALITVVTLTFIWRTRPDLLYRSPRRATATSPRSLLTR